MNLSSNRTRLALTVAFGLLIIVSVLVLGVIEKNRTGSVITDVLRGSSFFSTELNNLGDMLTPGRLIGLSLAFASGMVAAVNPCGFAMLPAYLSLYLNDTEAQSTKPLKQFGRAILVSLTIGGGFIIVFGILGLILAGASSTTSFFSSAFPWIGFALGLLMVVLGVYILLGGKLYSALPQKYASRIGTGGQVGIRAYFLFGLSYALASLSCTLPIFIVNVVNAFSSGGFGQGLLTFLVYALGMTLIITLVTLGMAFFKSVLVRFLFKILPAVSIISAVIIVLVGCYIILYWLVEGNLICIEGGRLAFECGVLGA